MLITFKAKVKLISEDQMEIDSSDMNIKFDGKWVWRSVAIPYSDIFRVVQYSRDKTLVYLYGYNELPEMLLVNEDYKTVFDKWNAFKLDFQEEETTDEEPSGDSKTEIDTGTDEDD